MTRRRSPQIPAEKVPSQRELARQMHVSRSTVDRWRRDGLTPDSRGHYDLSEARRFQRARTLKLRDMAAAGKTARDGVFALKEARLKVDLQMAEHKLACARGEFISKRDVVRAWREAVVTVKNRFLSLPRELAPHLVGRGPREIESVLNGRICEILRLLARSEDRSKQQPEPVKPSTNGHPTSATKEENTHENRSQ